MAYIDGTGSVSIMVATSSFGSYLYDGGRFFGTDHNLSHTAGAAMIAAFGDPKGTMVFQPYNNLNVNIYEPVSASWL